MAGAQQLGLGMLLRWQILAGPSALTADQTLMKIALWYKHSERGLASQVDMSLFASELLQVFL